MATHVQIESADRKPSRPVGAGMDTTAQHVLGQARADEARTERDRAKARRVVLANVGERVGEILAMLDLGEDDEPADAGTKRCPACEQTKPKAAFHRRSGLRSYSSHCKSCKNERRREVS